MKFILLVCPGILCNTTYSQAGVFFYENNKPIYPEYEELSFSLKRNEKQYELSFIPTIQKDKEDERLHMGRIMFPELTIDSTDILELTLTYSSYTIKANLNHFKNGNELKIGTWTELHFCYFKSYKKYQQYCSTHNCSPVDYEITEENFTNWHLFHFPVGHERFVYIPIEMITVTKAEGK